MLADYDRAYGLSAEFALYMAEEAIVKCQAGEIKSMSTELISQLAAFFSCRPEILFSWLFGSYATGKNNAYSDVDIAVYVANPLLLHDVD